MYETQGKVQKFRPYIDSCAVGGLQSKRTQVKMYLRGGKIYSSEVKTYPVCSQNVPCYLYESFSKFVEILNSCLAKNEGPAKKANLLLSVSRLNCQVKYQSYRP